MTHPLVRRSFLAVLLLAPVAGCDTPVVAVDTGMEDAGTLPDAEPVDTGIPPVDSNVPPDSWSAGPAFRTPHPEIEDGELAMQALRILGAPEAGATEVYCNDCHSLSRGRIRYWRALSDTSMATCLTDLSVASDASAASMLTCLGGDGITTHELGIWATAAHLPWFNYVFQHGFTPDPTAAHTAFVDRAGMPPAPDHVQMTQEQFDIVAEWFLRGVPELDSIIPADTAPAECLPGVSADVLTHVSAMETTGWTARNRAAGLLSYGCAGATTPEGCLAAEPLAADSGIASADQWGTVATGGVAGAQLRVLFTTAYRTSWWTRTSADGRWVSHGAASAPNLRFIDLTNDSVIGGAADYDTFFFPDNSGFLVQSDRTGPRLCETRVLLTDPAPTMLAFNEAGCSAGTGIALYEHLGASLDGGDYWAIASNGGETGATYDNGGHAPTRRQPIAGFPASSSSRLTLMTNDGTRFVVNGDVDIAHPYEGDATISPSARLMITRAAGPGDVSTGYVLHSLTVTGSGSSMSVASPEIGRYCITGAKPAFSLDERVMVTHHYITDADAVELGFTGPDDPGFAEYRTIGGANVYMVDLTTGASYRITNMAPGQYALFPHFRADGWMYFMVRTQAATPEHVVASDALLVLEGG